MHDKEYRELVEGYGDKLFRLAFMIIGDSQMSEDVVQESFLALYRNMDKFRGDSAVTTWLTRVAINNSKNILRRRKIKNIFTTSKIILKDSSPLPEEALEITERQREIRELLLSLPIKYREVLYLYYYQDSKVKEIAEILDISESGIKSRLQRGREHMKKLLLEREAD
ncbi:RNA polymerase, sigma-24 subunit, ECF subfamily [Alkaliphilus metalliredigens QYMF]|uniref:RNA polymerase, sigma-24 subunit, ECF subfamily n=1 Tax=Alkaliphilus metalliredigens (strain QYMF) TaxID=293826 RepID=A6TQ40_ALKMQ|nr:sigma-70 family RNA polymerase sigma factor [Alkaliphilus metalliredigens]ABR48308.1 RNA polymerase, sigma-24 subunit, ECF subfamily [Alkaliphilus metalliredigens QYMF]